MLWHQKVHHDEVQNAVMMSKYSLLSQNVLLFKKKIVPTLKSSSWRQRHVMTTRSLSWRPKHGMQGTLEGSIYGEWDIGHGWWMKSGSYSESTDANIMYWNPGCFNLHYYDY